jgi:hypothetical protein
MGVFSRPLDNIEVIELFLERALELDHKKFGDISNRILSAELGVNEFEIKGQTLNETILRSTEYRKPLDRWNLRRQIISELSALPRLESDDEINLGAGGALPLTEIQSTKEAFVIIGLPASGKSTLANRLSDDFGAVILDTDYAKRKLPEFHANLYGATIVNSESSAIIWGFGEDKPTGIEDLSSICFANGFNVVVPMIGSNPKKVAGFTDMLRKASYDVHLILVALSKKAATVRAIKRFHETSRYVPLGLIFDHYGNDPSLCYYYLKSKYFINFKSMAAVVASEGSYYCTDLTAGSPVENYEFKDLIMELP